MAVPERVCHQCGTTNQRKETFDQWVLGMVDTTAACYRCHEHNVRAEGEGKHYRWPGISDSTGGPNDTSEFVELSSNATNMLPTATPYLPPFNLRAMHHDRGTLPNLSVTSVPSVANNMAWSMVNTSEVLYTGGALNIVGIPMGHRDSMHGSLDETTFGWQDDGGGNVSHANGEDFMTMSPSSPPPPSALINQATLDWSTQGDTRSPWGFGPSFATTSRLSPASSLEEATTISDSGSQHHNPATMSDMSLSTPSPFKKEVSSPAIRLASEKRRRKKAKFPCTFEGCISAFTRRTNLRDHIRAHKGERPHACGRTACPEWFTRKKDRDRHESGCKHA